MVVWAEEKKRTPEPMPSEEPKAKKAKENSGKSRKIFKFRTRFLF